MKVLAVCINQNPELLVPSEGKKTCIKPMLRTQQISVQAMY